MNFKDVSISIPTKVRGAEAEEEWQEIDWTTWTSGSLEVDSDSFLLTFKPSQGGAVKAKPLGGLIRATAVDGGEEAKTLIATTTESCHRSLRLTFPSADDASRFRQVAQRAEAAHEASMKLKVTQGVSDALETSAALDRDIRAKLTGKWPIVFSGAELYGPDPNGPSTNEVLLGRGAAVLLDPPEDSRTVGNYELVFYGEDEGADKPLKRIAVGPKMLLERQADDDEDGPAVTFLLTGPSIPAHTICFDETEVACKFARDFRVRCRLLDISHKTVKGQKSAESLREEIAGMKQRSLAARCVRAVRSLMLLVTLAVFARAVMLYAQDTKKRHPREYLQDVSKDLRQVAKLSLTGVQTATAQVCEAAVGSVSTESIRLCAEEANLSDMRHCLNSLIAR
eukprot:TRINITY_DN29164_c0_g1_i1.p1 TRINITY_DN29164_c0_g1~~TRINITY_DN29164_c0_g1_i1.p1  ORF type:complete len:396 (-),score=77.83 TRINITY_DN29164_c0_g1_i1:33-1220(-)